MPSLPPLPEFYKCHLCRGVSCRKPICDDCERAVAGIIGWAEREQAAQEQLFMRQAAHA